MRLLPHARACLLGASALAYDAVGAHHACEELNAAVREAGSGTLDNVAAVVSETDGTISVIPPRAVRPRWLRRSSISLRRSPCHREASVRPGPSTYGSVGAERLRSRGIRVHTRAIAHTSPARARVNHFLAA